MPRILILAGLLLLVACGSPDTTLRATSVPYPTNAPSTPGPSPTPEAAAYPYPAPALLAMPFDPHVSALWDSAISATIQWTQQVRGCLYKETALHTRGFIGCYERDMITITITLGGSPTDGNDRPLPGDVYILVTDGVTYRAPLVGRPQYLPAFF